MPSSSQFYHRTLTLTSLNPVRPNPKTNEQKAQNSTEAMKRHIMTEAQGKLHLSVSMSVEGCTFVGHLLLCSLIFPSNKHSPLPWCTQRAECTIPCTTFLQTLQETMHSLPHIPKLHPHSENTTPTNKTSAKSKSSLNKEKKKPKNQLQSVRTSKQASNDNSPHCKHTTTCSKQGGAN